MTHLLLKPRKYSDNTNQKNACHSYAVQVQHPTRSLTRIPSPALKPAPNAA